MSNPRSSASKPNKSIAEQMNVVLVTEENIDGTRSKSVYVRDSERKMNYRFKFTPVGEIKCPPSVNFPSLDSGVYWVEYLRRATKYTTGYTPTHKSNPQESAPVADSFYTTAGVIAARHLKKVDGHAVGHLRLNADNHSQCDIYNSANGNEADVVCEPGNGGKKHIIVNRTKKSLCGLMGPRVPYEPEGSVLDEYLCKTCEDAFDRRELRKT